MKPAAPRFSGRQHTARSLALHVLLTCRYGDAFIQEVLDSALTTHHSPLTNPDRRLATQLAYGVLRRRGTLDALLRAVVSRQKHEVEPWLWETLRLGAFQLALLTHIPAHAAINETVELAAVFGRPGAKGFVNGVLRALSQLLTGEEILSPAANALPLEAGRYRRLARPVLPDPTAEPVQYVAAAFSLPRWLVEGWHGRFGWDELVRLGFWFAGPAPLWLRVNRLRTERTAFLDALRVANIAAEPGEVADSVRLTDHVTIRELPGYAEGWFSVQDASAMRVAAALNPQPGMRILDLCAAPGGKTTHLAERMNNQGSIVACDVDDHRLKTVSDLARRLGITIIETKCLASAARPASGGRKSPGDSTLDPPDGPFDAILVDVPCSNTGVLGRRPEVRWRLKPADFEHLVPLQTKLLIQAGERVRPGGAIVYSTCSIEPEENRQVVDNVLRALADLQREAEEEQLPGKPADGGYWARLRRR
jgi:16S rRNA (cytosine967-C5)-methyltransferase